MWRRPCTLALTASSKQTCSDFEVVIIDAAPRRTPPWKSGRGAPLQSSARRLVIHSGPDQGIYDAMNHGVGMATGAWLLFLGADDTLYEADTLARVGDFISEHEPRDFVYGEVIRLSRAGLASAVFSTSTVCSSGRPCATSRSSTAASFSPASVLTTCATPSARTRDFNIRCFSNPALAIRFMDIVIANWNDVDGFGQQVVDKEFKKRLPKHLGYRPYKCLTESGRPSSEKETRKTAWSVVRRMSYVAYQARKAKSKSRRPAFLAAKSCARLVHRE